MVNADTLRYGKIPSCPQIGTIPAAR